MTALTKAEREIILVISDDERSWHIHTDSLRAASTRLRKVAQAWGVTPQREGAGYEFDLPLGAVRFAGPGQARKPLSEAQRAARAKFAAASRIKKSAPGTEAASGISGLGALEG